MAKDKPSSVQVPISREMARDLRKQRKAFIKKFGREPGPGDPVFFDPDAPGPEPVQMSEAKARTDMLKAMSQAGAPPAIIYAFSKSGLILSKEGIEEGLYPPDVVAEWEAAVDEYFRLEDEGKRE